MIREPQQVLCNSYDDSGPVPCWRWDGGRHRSPTCTTWAPKHRHRFVGPCLLWQLDFAATSTDRPNAKPHTEETSHTQRPSAVMIRPSHRRSNVLTTLELSSGLKGWWQSYGGGVGDSRSGSSSISGVPGSSYSSNDVCSGSTTAAGAAGAAATMGGGATC